MTQLQKSIVSGTEAIEEMLDAGVAHLLGPQRAEHWRSPRAQYLPRVVSVSHDGVTLAAALVSGRPATAARKIVDLWYGDRAAGMSLLDNVVDLARTEGIAVLKWEVPAGAELPAFAAEAGFLAMRAPWSAIGTEAVRGYARWLVPVVHDEAGYYAQTTEFTCGAVAALLAAEAVGRPGFVGDHTDRRREIDFWRAASNYPACEPVGLAVALHRHLGEQCSVEVTSNDDKSVLLEDFTGFDREFRLELQRDSLSHAVELQIPLRTDWIEVDEISARVAGGEIALLLINQLPMHAHSEPHWITAHASDRRSVLIVQDPWIDKAGGETWVDAHDLPIRLTEVDSMCRWGAHDYRGVVFLAGRRSDPADVQPDPG